MFIVVRHGNTFEADEQPRRIGARTDLPLTRKGREQACALGGHFAKQGWRFGRVLASPMLRTLQTAQEILAMQASPPRIESAGFLREVDHGPDENMPEHAIVERIGQQSLESWDRHAQVPPGWIAEPEARMAEWRKLYSRREAQDDPVLLVTSNGAARFGIIADPALRAAAADLPSLKLPTGGFGIIARSASGRLCLKAWGLRP